MKGNLDLKKYLDLTVEEFTDFLCNNIACDLVPKSIDINKTIQEFKELKAKSTITYTIVNKTTTI